MLATDMLNDIQVMTSKALADSEISYEEYTTITNE